MADTDPKSLEDLLAGDYALALSGGGIRSATISLGIAQALALKERLGRLKTVSTVSGGGYFGAFLKSLYIPQKARGLDGADMPPDTGRAATVLRNRNSPEIDWLRRHSRYLVPNGSGDWWSAIATLTRNWAAMAYLFFIAAAVAALALLLAELAIVWATTAAQARDRPEPWAAVFDFHGVSPLIWAIVPAWFVSAATGVAYWYTEPMSANPEAVGDPASLAAINRKAALWLSALVAATFAAAALFTALLLIGLEIVRCPAFACPVWPAPRSLLLPVTIAGTAFAVSSAAIAFVVAWRERKTGILATAVRRRLTGYRASALRWLVAIVAVAVIDTAGIALRATMGAGSWRLPLTGTALATLVTLAAHRLAKLGSSNSGPILTWLRRHLQLAALLVGALLWGGLAAVADALVHALVWSGTAWASPVDVAATIIGGSALVLLLILIVLSDGFVNLSSLHNLYASRLTRAYLGGTNTERLDAPNEGKFTETHPADYIDARRYFVAGGPDHIVNIALAETRDPATKLPERDRQALILSIGRDGIRQGPAPASHRPWPADEPLETPPIDGEALPIGEWIAISGAAVGTGMGRMTSAGGALLFTFANARLGYWWRQDKTIAARYRLLGPYPYLVSEMLALYSSDTHRVYLSDGGHFENSGVYGILLRQVDETCHPGVVIAADNGEDAGFRFEDLEQLTRRARLDLGWSIDVMDPGILSDRAGAAAKLFLNGDPAKAWRDRAGDPADGAIALWLAATKEGRTPIDIIWLKPRATRDLPTDVAGYAGANPDFPHQSTGDQFFDEAQFESYRVLGECMMTRLLSAA